MQELVEYCKLVEPDGRVLVRHLDNVKENNDCTNLAWGSSKDNADDFKASELYKPWMDKKFGKRVKNNAGLPE